MSARQDDTDPTLAALTVFGRDVVEVPTAEELDQGLDVFFTRVAARKARRRGIVRWTMLGGAVAATLLLGLRLSTRSGTAPAPVSATMDYQIQGGTVLSGGYLRESGQAGITLRFNEGSQVALAPGTRGRLRAVDKDGARVAIENGRASFEVTPSDVRKWWVEVGPFMVAVKGTVFTASWDPPSERFELTLRHGRVVVSGPVPGGDVTLRAGQRLQVSLARAEAVISDEPLGEPADPGAPSTASASAGERPSVAPDQPAARTTGGADRGASHASPKGGRRWARELASGDWDRILADVERAGVGATLKSASSDDLLAVASAARYRRRTDLAESALQTIRRRFPTSPRALDAIFLLGRVAELREHGAARAIGWYDAYLARGAAGDFAGEALGRKMILVGELQGPPQARPIAEAYLRRFPQGSYAGSARALLGSR